MELGAGQTRKFGSSYDRHKTHSEQQVKYNCSCQENSDAENCPLYGQCREPLAWNLEKEHVMTQVNCPLYTIIPKELRDLIWEFALKDCTSNPPDREPNRPNPLTFTWAQGARNYRASGLYPSDIAVNLLQTCRAVYLETYTLPLSLNPYIILNLSHAVKTNLLPWQFAYIQGLDITLQQTALEGTVLLDYVLRRGFWCPLARHKGVYVAPQRYYVSKKGPPRDPKHLRSSPHFMLVDADKDVPTKRLTDALKDSSPRWSPPPGVWPTVMRVTLARPLVHLTLRLRHRDWWTWTDDPNSVEGDKQLGLDPAVGDGSSDPNLRPTSDRMRLLADERRAGRLPNALNNTDHRSDWGHTVIGRLPDLKTLELVLETFADKKSQLENVIECAKTWRFPIDGTRYELLWDGQVEKSSWSKAPEDSSGTEQHAPWYSKCTDFEVRIVRFTRKRAL